jgi:TrmH family RNA methyltransferase
VTFGGDKPIVSIDSPENGLIKQLRRLAEQSTAYRKLGQFWIEGDHLCRAALERKLTPAVAVLAQSFASSASAGWVQAATKTVVVPDALFDAISGLKSSARVGFLLDLPAKSSPQQGLATVVLDRVQDAGNVGSILRSAAAFGFKQVLSLKGSAALWSPKVLRAGMGAHFGLDLVEGLDPSEVMSLGVPLVVTSSHHGELLQDHVLPWPCCWAFGHEGQGLGDALLARADLSVRIGQPGGEESLNVAAAAAICLHASAVSEMVRTP